MFAFTFAGCWDNKDIEELFIVEGVGVDLSTENENELIVSVQIGSTQKKEYSSSGGMTGTTPIISKVIDSSLANAFNKINLNSSRLLFLHHNKVYIFGQSLAEKGLSKHIDTLLRNPQARLEIPIVIVEGKAEDVIKAQLSKEKLSSEFLAKLAQEMAKISSESRSRIIDVAKRLVDKTYAPVVPLIKLENSEEEGKQEIKQIGMAIFKNDVMVGSFSIDDLLGYYFAYGNVTNISTTVKDENGEATFYITKTKPKKKILVEEENVKVNLMVEIELKTTEIKGFVDMEANQLYPHLEQLLIGSIKEKINNVFDITKIHKTDIFGFGSSIAKKEPKKWKKISDKWDEIYPEIELEIEVKAKISTTGEISKSIEMEKKINDNR